MAKLDRYTGAYKRHFGLNTGHWDVKKGTRSLVAKTRLLQRHNGHNGCMSSDLEDIFMGTSADLNLHTAFCLRYKGFLRRRVDQGHLLVPARRSCTVDLILSKVSHKVVVS
jgi:hypothetical protein